MTSQSPSVSSRDWAATRKMQAVLNRLRSRMYRNTEVGGKVPGVVRFVEFMIKAGRLLLLGGMGFMLFQAMEIYASLGRGIGGSITWSLGADWVSGIWLIGPLLALPLRLATSVLNWADLGFLALFFVIVGLILQALEIAPTLLYNSPALLEHVTTKYETIRKLTINRGDSASIKKLKTAHNDYYDNFLDSLEFWRNVAYVIDMCICFFSAPIIKGGYGVYQSIALVIGMNHIDWWNVFRIACTLFLVQVTLWVWLQLRKGAELMVMDTDGDGILSEEELTGIQPPVNNNQTTPVIINNNSDRPAGGVGGVGTY